MEINVKQLTFQSAGMEQAVTGWIYVPSGALYGVVVISHGMLEDMGRYHDFMRFLAKAGYVAAGIDHLGHGLTGKEHLPGYFAPENGWKYLVENQRKLVRILTGEYPGLPVFLMGHSMGSFVARLYAAKYGERLAGLLLSGTNLYNPRARLAAMKIEFLVKKHGGEFADSAVTAELLGGVRSGAKENRTILENAGSNGSEQTARDSFTLGGWLDVLTLCNMSAQKKCFEQTPDKLPVLIFAGDGDKVGRNGKDAAQIAKNYIKTGVEDVTCHIYGGMRHDTLHNANCSRVYSDVLEWLNDHTEQAKKRLPS